MNMTKNVGLMSDPCRTLLTNSAQLFEFYPTHFVHCTVQDGSTCHRIPSTNISRTIPMSLSRGRMSYSTFLLRIVSHRSFVLEFWGPQNGCLCAYSRLETVF